MNKSRLLLGLFLIFLFTVEGLSLICANGSGDGYDETGSSTGTSNNTDNNGTSKTTSEATGNNIEAYVIEGAGHYLNAQSGVLRLLNRIEMAEISGLNNYEAWILSENILRDLDKAIYTYEILISKAECTPYKEEYIRNLNDFNYELFMRRKGLNSIIYSDVSNYLKAGDITGSYKKIHSHFIEIRAIVYRLHLNFYWSFGVDIELVWQLQEKCDYISSFGRYMAMTFYEIRKIN